MTSGDLPPFARLSERERQRLGPGVNAVALERFIAAAGPEARLFAILAFVTEISEAELRTAAAALGQPDFLGMPSGGDPGVSIDHPPTEPGMVGYYALPSPSYDLQLSRPEDPAFRALFDEIEPRPSGAV